MEPRLATNKAQCGSCRAIVRSRHTHSFVTCRCGNLSVDGGLSYLRRSWKIHNWTELSTHEDGTPATARFYPPPDERT